MTAAAVIGLAALIAAVLAAVLAATSARRRWTIVRVRGMSMMPTYADGDRLLVRLGRRGWVRDDVVVFHPPGRRRHSRRPGDPEWLMKRVVAVAGQPIPADVRAAVAAVRADVVPAGCLVVRGDNPQSYDSRRFGYLRASDVVGTAVRMLAPYKAARVQ